MTVHADGSVSIADDGRGIPVGAYRRLRQEHAGGRPDQDARRRQVRPRHLQGLRRPARRRRHGGQRAVGVARGRGPPRRPGLAAGLRGGHPERARAAPPARRRPPARSSGSCPTPRSSTPSRFDYDVLEKRLRELAFLNRGVRINLLDERGDEPKQQQFHSAAGPARVRRLPEPGAGAAAPAGGARGPRRRAGRRGRGRAAVQRLDQRERRQLLQQHQHRRGGHPPDRVPLGADPDAEHLRQGQRAGDQEGPGDHRRGLQGGPDGDRQRAGARPAVRGADQDQAGQRRGRGDRRQGRQREARRVPRTEPAGGQERHQEGAAGGRGPRGRPQGPRAGPQPQGGALRRRPARQADGLHHPRPGLQRAVPRRGRLGRRHRRGGPRPPVPGDPARCGARSSTSSAPGSTGSWATRRSATSSRPSATASARRRTPRSGATARS